MRRGTRSRKHTVGCDDREGADRGPPPVNNRRRDHRDRPRPPLLAGSIAPVRHWGERLPILQQFASNHRVLQIGSGRGASLFNACSLDLSLAVRPDVVADLNQPLPFRDASFDGVLAFSILEHVNDLFPVLLDIHRILRPGGVLVALVPHAASASAFTDPTHRQRLSALSFDYLVAGTALEAEWGFYAEQRFRMNLRLLELAKPWTYTPLQRWANRNLNIYERHLCYLIRPSGIYVELERAT